MLRHFGSTLASLLELSVVTGILGSLFGGVAAFQRLHAVIDEPSDAQARVDWGITLLAVAGGIGLLGFLLLVGIPIFLLTWPLCPILVLISAFLAESGRGVGRTATLVGNALIVAFGILVFLFGQTVMIYLPGAPSF